jgi:hypothetical protein
MPTTMPIRDPRCWPALLLAAGLMALGGVFILAPGVGADIFGLPRPEGEAAAWLAVVGLRDLVFGGYVVALAVWGSRRALGIVLAVTALIPVGDIAVLLAVRGPAAGWHLLLHLLSAAVVSAVAAWTLWVSGAPRSPAPGSRARGSRRSLR